jgi:hypothetical protein
MESILSGLKIGEAILHGPEYRLHPCRIRTDVIEDEFDRSIRLRDSDELAYSLEEPGSAAGESQRHLNRLVHL